MSAPAGLRLHHIGLVVPDLPRAVRFYSEALGFAVLFEGGWEASETFDGITGLEGSAARVAMLRGPCGMLELFAYTAPTPRGDPSGRRASDMGLRHICIECEDPAALAETIRAAGGRDEGRVVAVPGGATAIYCRDPFGNIIELVRPGGRLPSAAEG